MLLSSLSTGFL